LVKGLRCGRCRDAVYCSKACQAAHWPLHKLPCAKACAVLARTKRETAAKDYDWRGKCVVCRDVISEYPTVLNCCTKRLCNNCADAVAQKGDCPLCSQVADPSDSEYVRRMRKHVDAGDADAEVLLGLAYKEGNRGLDVDAERAVLLFTRAAEQGHAVAMFELGNCSACGIGCAFDAKAAFKWYKSAAALDYPEAQYNVGIYYHNGQGVEQSFQSAAEWYGRAAAHGDVEALCNLGGLHRLGLGVPQDAVEALRFYDLAAARGDAKAVEQAVDIRAEIGRRQPRPALTA